MKLILSEEITRAKAWKTEQRGYEGAVWTENRLGIIHVEN